jgi:hypothetical protein
MRLSIQSFVISAFFSGKSLSFPGFLVVVLLFSLPGHSASVPTLEQAIDSKEDLWGDLAMAQPNGASYEFFEPLLPPLRYVNADFRYYPIVLSAANSKVKARLISNGSGVNLPGGARSWRDVGTPITFRVGPDELRFGEIAARLEHPTLADGFLPIPEIKYSHATEVYKLEAFASADAGYADNCVVFVKFSLASGTNGVVTVQVDSSPLKFGQGKVTDANGNVLVHLDDSWTWERERARAKIGTGKSAIIAIATKPLSGGTSLLTDSHEYERQRELAVQTWDKLLAGAMNLETPEPYVNNAWRHLIVQNFQLINGDKIHYSAGNQYDALYESEGSDAATALQLWGYEADARRLLAPLFDFTRVAIQFNQAGQKLDDLVRYYWQTRDAEFIRFTRPKWEKEIKRILDSRGENGLLQREHYCNDIPTPVFSLNSNGKCWRGLRGMSSVLSDMGERAESEQLAKTAADFRAAILVAVQKSTYTNTQPPFIPIALFGEESPYDPICATKMGSYWNLMANFVLGFEVLGPGSDGETAILGYIQQHGGLCMGMERARPWPSFWNGTQSVNPLYGMRYVLTLLRRDEPERALVSFYGMLAQGFTRNTFVAGEGSSLTPLDEFGRQFYCPPNSAGNADFLQMLRYLLVQDWDLDDNGKPETLRLAFATPKRWLEDGKTIKVERAPTAFGPVSFQIESHLNRGEIMAEIDPPHRNRPKLMQLRVRLPNGWKIISAENDSQTFQPDDQGMTDITLLKSKTAITFRAKRSSD